MQSFPTTPRDAFDRLSRLAEALAAPERRAAALEELRALAAQARGQPEGAPLRLITVDVAIGSKEEHLELFLLPSIFAPEAWAFTFLEGLLKVPSEELQDKGLVEVGTGSGWIPIALAKLSPLARIHGLDLNPQAPAVARCNVWLNCSEAEAARLSFQQSDLLDALPAEAQWDFVVGCIPQVLSESLPDELHEAEEQELYDLSNYCTIQNVYEDSFGLGLIARLLDDCPEYLAPGGRLLLNLAGRPGRSIIQRMFSRRGFATEVLVARRVRQAGDTDIRPLVALEHATDSEFEFYISQHSAEPIRAETALGWAQSGRPIWHEVAVWEARLREPRETLALRSSLRALGAEALLRELDLGDASQEKLDFAASLAARLARQPLVPYAHEAGDPSFRRLICRYLERFFGLLLSEREVFVAPEREQAVHSLLLATCDPGDEVLISRNLHGIYEGALAKAGVRATVTNDTLREIHQLLEVFDPKLVLLSVPASERSNWSQLLAIVDEAARRGIHVVLDESAFFNITSGVEPGTLFELLAREAHRPNLVVLYGLIKNEVFPDFELSLLLPVPGALAADLEVAAELTYSRISTPVEWLYEHLFSELLSFRISFSAGLPPPVRRQPVRPLPRSARIAALAQAPAFAPKVFAEGDPRLIRLDYGENESLVPMVLSEGLLAACLAPKAAPAPALAEGIVAFLEESRGLRFEAEDVVVSQGVWPLMHDAALALCRELGRQARIFVAAPCYGLLPPTLEAAGAALEVGPLERLHRSEGGFDAVVISQPANPEGRYLDRGELERLVAWAERAGARIFSDEIFGLVNLGDPDAIRVLSPAALPGGEARTLIFGGLSKEFAAGGLRVGWAATRDRAFAERMREVTLAPLHLVTTRAAAHVYGAWMHGPQGELLHPARRESLRAYLGELRRGLAAKRAPFVSIFPSAESATPGGLFVAPRVEAWLGKEIDGERITPENLPALIYRHTGVVVNGGAWCSDRERLRLVFSIPEDKAQEAAQRLAAFAARVEGSGRG